MMNDLREYIEKLEAASKAQAELENIKDRLNHVFQYIDLDQSRNYVVGEHVCRVTRLSYNKITVALTNIDWKDTDED
jgi:DNA mismatch repair ATPase MutS